MNLGWVNKYQRKVGFGLAVSAMSLAVSLAWAAPVDPNDNNSDNNRDFPTNPDVSYANNLVSVSSDGHYAVTSNLDNEIILWDLQKHTHKIIAHHANSYSAYYIKNSPYFMWQSLSKNQLTYAASAGKPPQEKIALVAQNKLAIISKEQNKYYLYFYMSGYSTPGLLNNVKKMLVPGSINAQYLIHGNLRHFGDYFDFSPYVDQYVKIAELPAQYRFLQILISLGYHSGNIVHVQDPAGHEALHFDNFPVYGQVMRANLKDYFASSFNWNLFKGFGANQQLMMLDDGGFLDGKLLNLSLASNKPLLLTSGDADPDISKVPLAPNNHFILGNFQYYAGMSRIAGVTLWNTKLGHPIHKFVGNDVKTYATLSPDANYVVAGDENENLYVWNLKNFKRMEDWSMSMGIAVAWKNEIVTKFNTKGLIKPPKGFHDSQGDNTEVVVSIKFIDQSHYLRFTTGIPYAVLFSVTNPKPLKYYYLGKTWPAIFDYSQDEALDSSPSKHILVMAMSGQRGGILEYKYNPKTMSLKRVWIGHLPLPPSAYGIHPKKKHHFFNW